MEEVFTSTTTWKPKNFEESWKLNFDLCRIAEINIQVSLNMHLYDDIGDASLSLRRSISRIENDILFVR